MANNDEAIDADILLDRLVSASTSEDVETALHQILDAKISITEDSVWTALISIFHDGSCGNLQVPDGRTTAGRILLESLQTNKTPATTLLEAPGRILESCIDVACSDGSEGIYARILALQLLQELSNLSLIHI